MNRSQHWLSIVVSLQSVLILGAQNDADTAPVGGLRGGGEIRSFHGPHFAPEQRAESNEAIETMLLAHPEIAERISASAGTTEKFAFYPMAGRLYRDLFIVNFVDLQFGAGILDFECTDITYNGHDASDTDLRSFGEQFIGVPIFAALDGTVLQAVDGRNDMNTCPNLPCNGLANFVVVGHAGGRRTSYLHMKKNSVAVTAGQIVKAGQQLGLTASSGNSSGPHLHFAVYDNNGSTLVEPFEGACQSDESQWIDQPVVERDLYMRDFGVTYEDMNAYPGWPYVFPRSGQIALGDPFVYFWMLLNYLPANSTWRTQFRRPNGTIAFDSGTSGFGNPDAYRWSWWWWGWNIAEMHTTTGTWHVLFDLNGNRIVEAPVEVRTARTPEFNRAPVPITVSLQPSVPTAFDVVFCNVNTDLVLDDLDYDIVRYHYVWDVDGNIVRDVVTAAHSDALPHHVATPESLLACTVTPSDGIADGATASASVSIAPGTCPAQSAPTAEASPIGKSRYLSFTPGNPGEVSALRVKLTNIAGHPSLNGQFRWVGPPAVLLENDGQSNWTAAALQCGPYVQDWGGVGLLHVYGTAVIPGSTYDIQAVQEDCVAGDESEFSSLLTVPTGKWGDNVSPFGGLSQPNFGDISATVERFRTLPSAPGTMRTDFIGSGSAGTPNLPDRNVNFADISADVEAYRGFSYAYTPGTCP